MMVKYYEDNNHYLLEKNELTDNEIHQSFKQYDEWLTMDVYEEVYADSYLTLTDKGVEKCKAFNLDENEYSFFLA